MPHLSTTRKGWQNEHLALFILSRISFCANPVTVSDDLGSDYFCCLFETRNEEGNETVLPLNSFAIQIKSGLKTLDASGKVKYLSELEVPFFIGVVNRKEFALEVFSGEYLPYFFFYKGLPKRLRLKPVKGNVSADTCFEPFGEKKFRLMCPWVTTVRAGATRAELRGVVRQLSELCRRAHRNIPTRRTEEHIYTFAGKPRLKILAGPGSAKVFRQNFYNRLAEAYFNFEWLIRKKKRLNLSEVRAYLECYRQLERLGADFPRILIKRYKELVALLHANN